MKQTQPPKVGPKSNGGKQPRGKSVINSNGEAVKQGDKLNSKHKNIAEDSLIRKGGGKNAQHANQRKREVARGNYEKAKAELEKFEKESRG